MTTVKTTTQPSIQTEVDLSTYNTMALRSVCHTAYFLQNAADVQVALAMAEAQQLPVLVLSGGSNVILPDYLQAMVLLPRMRGIEVITEDAHHVDISVMAAENWHELVVSCVQKGWYGLENLALIPGMVGAAPVQNIGAYGRQIEDNLLSVTAYHIPSKQWQTLSRAQCEFGYRDSIFKQQTGQWLITQVNLRLHKDASITHAGYGDVKQYAETLAAAANREQINPGDVMAAIIAIRQSKLPDPKQLPNCGSFFKNPIISTAQFEKLQQQYPDVVGYVVSPTQTKIAAGWLIDNAGLKGQGIPPILTHDKQALVLTNHAPRLEIKHASQQDILATQSYIQQQVFSRYGITLQREPVWIASDGSVIEQ
nr:UDP-N-acetylmuramate dehydrogenase [Psychrobacter sp. I-STPA10]